MKELNQKILNLNLRRKRTLIELQSLLEIQESIEDVLSEEFERLEDKITDKIISLRVDSQFLRDARIDLHSKKLYGVD